MQLSKARSILSVALLVVAGLPSVAQKASPPLDGHPVDWTHHRLIFSAPPTPAEAVVLGKGAKREAVVNSLRYLHQQLWRNPEVRPKPDPHGPKLPPPAPKPQIHKDWSVSLGTGVVNPNTYPAKYSFSTTSFSCTSDYVAYPTGTAGATTTQATIVAYNELYGTTSTGCAHTPTPQVYWAYNTAFAFSTNTADGSIIKTSPVLSLDGTQVAFIQVASSVASLVLLKWSASTSVVALNTAGTNVAPSSYRSCTAPCMTKITLSGSPNDTWSSPFYDYEYVSGTADDTIYVGDDGGKLHKFTNIFISGTPAESGTGLALGAVGLASPVYDVSSGNIFVGSANGVLYSVSQSSFTLSAYTATLAASGGGIFDGPLVDGSAGEVYAFVGDSVSQASGCTSAGSNCVYQFATNFSGSGTATGSSKPIGTGGNTAEEQYLFAGAFDNIYYASSGGTAGNLYTQGNTNSNSGSLYRIPISGTGTMGTPVATVINQSQHPFGSPVTEFCNNGTSACVSSGSATTAGTDYVFFSEYNVKETGCSQGTGDTCIVAFNVTSGAAVFSSSLQESDATLTCFATGGIVVDNAIPSGTEVGASEIYFVSLNGSGNNLCGNHGNGNTSGIQSAQ